MRRAERDAQALVLAQRRPRRGERAEKALRQAEAGYELQVVFTRGGADEARSRGVRILVRARRTGGT